MKNFFAGVVYCLLYLVSLLPLGVHYFFSDILAFILKKIVRYRYSVITTNIARSFPDMKYGEIKKLTSRYYSYMCDLLFESIWDLAHSADAVRKRVSVSDVEVVDELQKKYGRVILVMGHCGNWEMVSGMMIPDAERTPDSYSSNPTYMLNADLTHNRDKWLTIGGVEGTGKLILKNRGRLRNISGTAVEFNNDIEIVSPDGTDWDNRNAMPWIQGNGANFDVKGRL
ncbi:MAG: hypothetical protein II041_01015, partial [Bacteroidales bacterium]|nr:hypothetical protein [Bacteroidales bacterium]